MNKEQKIVSSDDLASSIIEGMTNLKGKEIISLNLSDIETAVCDYFIVCHGTSNTHVSSLADGVIDNTLKDHKEKPWNKEGFENSEWILLDYGNVVAHIFQQEIREYYNIEKLWADAKVRLIEDK